MRWCGAEVRGMQVGEPAQRRVDLARGAPGQGAGEAGRVQIFEHNDSFMPFGGRTEPCWDAGSRVQGLPIPGGLDLV